MKPALLEVMRMNRICRMVLATCLGSFILVIFYFQSMLHPGRGRVSVVLLDIFSSLALAAAPPGSCLFHPDRSCLGHLGAPGGPVRPGSRRREEVLPPRLPLGPGLGRMGPAGAVVFFFSSSFFSLCVSCLSVCEVAGEGRGGGKPRRSGGVGLKKTKLPPHAGPSRRMKEAPAAGRAAPGALPLPGGGARGAGCRLGRDRESPPRAPEPRAGLHVSGAGRRAQQVWGERGVPGAAPPPGRGKGGVVSGAGCVPPGSGSALTLRLVPLGLLQPPCPPPPPAAPGPPASWLRAPQFPPCALEPGAPGSGPPQFWRKLLLGPG